MRVRCIAPYTAKMAMGHVASSAPGASQMYMSVLIGSCGSSGPVITLKPLWGSPGTELSTWSTGSLCCIRAIQRTRIASRPLRSYTAIQRYTALYTIQLYIAIHYTGYTTPLCGRAGSRAAGGRAQTIRWLLLDALKIRQRVHAWEMRIGMTHGSS